MGLLDILSGGDDPEQRQGMTALAMGLLGGGSFNEALSRGLAARQDAMNSYQDRSLKTKLTNAQLKQIEQTQAAAEQSLKLQKQANEYWNGLLQNGGQPAVQGQLGSGTAGIMPTPNGEDIVRQPINKNDLIKNLSAADVEMLERGGIKVADTWKFLNEPHSVAPGSTVVPVGGGPTWMAPKLDNGMEVEGGRVRNIPGYVESTTEQTSATEGAKTGASLIDVPVGGGRTVKMTFSDYQNYQKTGQLFNDKPAGKYDGVVTPAKPVISEVTGDFNPDNPGAVWKVIQSMPNGPEKTGLTAAYVKQFGGAKVPSVDSLPGATPSNLEKSQDEAMGKDFAELGKNIINTGMVARNTKGVLDNLEANLAKVGATGKLKPFLRDIQSIGSTFGVKPADWAGPADAVQSIAVGAALKLRQPGTGASSDKDFDNFISQIPSLSKTPEGNKLILDTLRATAKREVEISDILTKQFGGKYSNAAQLAIQDYVDKNPVFKPAPVDRFKGFSIVGRK